jgi:NADPH:quinone reductase-like Zn-dependent oxidoreductase
MKAIIWTRYGPPEVLQLQEIEKPVPKADEVLIKIHASTVVLGDCELRGLSMPPMYRLAIRLFVGFTKPTRVNILGQELSGEIEALGSEVSGFKVGDAICATTGLRLSGYAEYACLPAQGGGIALAPKPSNLSYIEAAGVPLGSLEALHFLRQASLQPGQKILIIGAGGSIGTYAVQLARNAGAEITAVDRGEKLEMLRLLGTQRVIDYTRQDYPQEGEQYDVIYDVVGKSDYIRCIQALSPSGVYLIGNPSLSHRLRRSLGTARRDVRVILDTATHRRADLEYIGGLIETEAIRPIIDRVYPLEQIVEAHRYVESGLKQGNVVVEMG